MDDKKSLGSTPIGYDINPTSYSFIRDLGASETSVRNTATGEEERKDGASGQTISDTSATAGNISQLSQKRQSKKKIVSYYIELELIDRVKKMADEEGSYYSAVVSRAIQAWIEHNGY